jgi:hypothetical protein
MKNTRAFKLFILSCLFFIPLDLVAKPACKKGKEIVSCNIKGGDNFSVCRVNKNKVQYKFTGKRKRSITLTSRPYYRLEKDSFASHETLRINNRHYDYVVNSVLVTNKQDKRRRKIRIAWLDVYKNKQKLAKLDCTNNAMIKTKGLKLVKDNLARYEDTRLYTKEEKKLLAKKRAKQQRQQQKTAAANKGYAVNLLSTSSKKKARRMQKLFKKEGYKVFIKATAKAGKTLYHVRIGTYKDKAAAQRTQKGMKQRYKRNTYVNKSSIVNS